MTISSTATRKAGPYSGNGSTVAFAFTFKVFADSDLVVTHTDDNGVETVKTLTTHYTATLNANQNSNPGGTVTMLTAPATGEKVTITSAVPKTQAVNLSDGGGFFASVVNNALDRLTIFSQELAEQVSRVMKLPVSAEDGTDPNLPTPEAGTVLGWNAGGDALVNYLPTDGGMPAPGAITATYMANDAIEEEAILDGAVTTDKLGALAVTAAKLAANAVETAKILDGAVTAAKLATDAVETAKIKDANVTAAKLAADVPSAILGSLKFSSGSIADPGGTGDKVTSGMGFRPRVLFVMAVRSASLTPAFSLGWAASASSECILYNYNTPPTEAQVSSAGNIVNVLLGGVASVASFDADGFTLNWSSYTATMGLAYLAIGW